MVERPRVGVGILITRDGQLLLLKRQNVHGAGSWSTPGGHLEFGESPEACAVREAKEETGVDVAAVRFRALTNDLFEADGRHYITIWLEGDYRSGEAAVAAAYEMSEVGWFPWDRLPAPLFLPLRNLLDGRCYPPPGAAGAGHPPDFDWSDPGRLVDRELELVLIDKSPADPAKGHLPAYKFAMHRSGQPEEIGRVDLRVGDTEQLRLYGGHLGYGVEEAHRGHRYAARACRLLLPLARRHGLRELWITCDPDNLASRRTCELAGAEFVEIVDLPPDSDMYQQGERFKCRYRIDL